MLMAVVEMVPVEIGRNRMKSRRKDARTTVSMCGGSNNQPVACESKHQAEAHEAPEKGHSQVFAIIHCVSVKVLGIAHGLQKSNTHAPAIGGRHGNV